MPEISLKDYFAKLNQLLSEHAVDEVLLHCRQILQFYPKNVTAYRFLGRALVMTGRWEEGREALRRVLSVIPDDYIAHLGLSEADEQVGRPDEAIWHLERAFEQRPNDKEIIDALRRLYSQYRNVSNLKIQLTSAAVARQYARSGAYTQAVDTLRSALTRMNERLDLKLLLAQILEQHGEEEEAAELALEVLGVLPDCLEANRIMANLWLSVNRPSDAQRYVNRLEAVDPYLAVEVAQGYPPEDDVFRLDELDYVRTSQSELASSRLDWLQEISPIPAPVIEGEQEAPRQDWSDWASAMLSGKAPPMSPEDAADELPAFDEEPMASERFSALVEEDEPVSTGFTAAFGRPDDADAEELSAMFDSASVDANDPMAWLHEAGVEIVEAGTDDEPAYEDLFSDDEDMPSFDEENPMAWLRESDRDAIIEDDDLPPQPAIPSSVDEELPDPFAWMDNEAGVTLEDVLSDAPEQDDEMDESSDWLQDNRLIDDALSLDGVTIDDIMDESIWDNVVAGSDDVADSDEAALDDDQSEEIVPGPRRGLTAMLQEANLDWITKPQEELSSAPDVDEWLTEFGAASTSETSLTDSPDWLVDLEQPQADDQMFTENSGESVSPFAVSASEEEAIGMSDDRFVEPENPEDDSVDWMRDLASDEQPDAEADLIASHDAHEADDDELAAAEIPDWMSELEPEAQMEAADAQDADEPSEDDMAWLAEAASDAEEQLEAVGIPGWVTENASETEAEEPETDVEAPDASDFPWMNEETAPETESAQESDAVAAELPDWMSELEPELESEASEEEDLSWISDEASDDELESDESEPVAAEIPDWVSELEPESDEDTESSAEESEAAAEEDLSWLDEESVAEGEAAVAAEMPDWMAELDPEADADARVPETEEAEIEAPDASDFPWMSEEADLDAEPEIDAEQLEPELAEPEMSDFPWMADGESESQPPAADGDFPWMSEEAESEPEADESAQPAAESIPRWLSEANEEDESAAVAPPSEDDLAWLDDGADESDAVDESSPDWLIGMEAAALAGTLASDEQPDADSELSGEFDEATEFDDNEDEEYAFLAEANDEPLEQSPAHNAPDWLNAMVPGLDVDYEPDEEEFVDDVEEPLDDESPREFVWLNNLVEEEMAATERPDFAFSRPPTWLGSSAALLDDDSLDDDFPDWPSDDADADVPEWLR